MVSIEGLRDACKGIDLRGVFFKVKMPTRDVSATSPFFDTSFWVSVDSN
jgi:hypothetical protein